MAVDREPPGHRTRSTGSSRQLSSDSVLGPVGGSGRITKTAKGPRKEPPRRECIACTRNLAASAFPKNTPTKGCTHPRNTCRTCLKVWIATQLQTTTFDKVSCPECLLRLCNQDVKVLATEVVYERFDELERRDFANKTPGWRWCLAPFCRAGQVHHPLATGSKSQRKRKSMICECKTCKAKACVLCDRPWHEGESCAQFQERLQKQKEAENEQATLETIQISCKACPKCKRNIEKNGGCDSMICTQCNTQFCWLCVLPYTTINVSGHAKSCMYSRPGHEDPHAAPIGGDLGPGQNWFGLHPNMFADDGDEHHGNA